MSKVLFVDGTLREGEQTPGVFFSFQEKLKIAHLLDNAGVSIIDLGMPTVSKQEAKIIRKIAKKKLRAKLGVSVRAKREDIDEAWRCGVEEAFVIVPTSRIHIKYKLRASEKDVERMAVKIIEYTRQKKLVANLVAEDASRADVGFLSSLINKVATLGAAKAFICDTVGIMTPNSMRTLIRDIRSKMDEKIELGVHCHNDFGLATANTLAAIEEGLRYAAVTVNGIGERAGNASLGEVALALQKLFHIKHSIKINRLYQLSKFVESHTGVLIPQNAPIVGYNVFRHESGIHVDGILKHTRTYEPMNPQQLRRKRSFVLGKHSGKHIIWKLLKKRNYKCTPEEVNRIIEMVKQTKQGQNKSGFIKIIKDIEDFNRNYLGFPEEKFWKIVNEVIGNRKLEKDNAS